MKLALAPNELAQLADFQRRHRVSLMCMVCTELFIPPALRKQWDEATEVQLLGQHDHICRDLLASFPGGIEISRGEGAFFLVFEKPSEAVRFLLQFQERLGILSRKRGHELALRAGAHFGEVLSEHTHDAFWPAELNAPQVDVCLILRSLARPGQLLLSRFAFESAQQSPEIAAAPGLRDLAWLSHGVYEVRPSGNLIEVCEVARGPQPVVRSPADNDRARRVSEHPDATELDGLDSSPETGFIRRLWAAPSAVRRPASIAAVVTALLGAFLLLTGWLDGISYDLMFLFRPHVVPEEVVVVELDSESHARLGQPSDDKWDRTLHARLLSILRAAGARAVCFDIAFTSASRNPEEDAAFEASLRTNRVGVLAARVKPSPLGIGGQIEAPIESLRAAAPWGICERSITGNAIRRPAGGFANQPGIVEVVARSAQHQQLRPPPRAWLNYYGPPGTIAHRSFALVLSNYVPAAAFSNRVVFVGANTKVGFTGRPGADYIRSPYSLWTGALAPGVEVNATSYANLVRDDWLFRVPGAFELVAILVAGAAAGYGLVFLEPFRATLAAASAALLLALVFMTQVWVTRHWFPWFILTGVQLPVALLCAVATRTRFILDQQRRLRKYLEARKTAAAAAATAPRTDSNTNPDRETLVEREANPARDASGNILPRVPDHELLKLIGQGAYGDVWLARDVIGGYHAVKILRRSTFLEAAPFEREFKGLQKYTPISRAHPGLVHILHIGRNDAEGFIYYIMEAGDDAQCGPSILPETYRPRNLKVDLELTGPLALPDVVRLGIELGEAVAFLHRSGLIHRDIKPANIIFVNHRPKLADIGLVTAITTPNAEGREGRLFGTPGFIPPEGPGAPAGDVYALGKLLYAVLTGQPAQEFPTMPPAIANQPDPDRLMDFLDLLLKACDPILTERFHSAEAFTAALRAFESKAARAEQGDIPTTT